MTTKIKTKVLLFSALACSALVGANPAAGQTNVGQWDFETNNLNQTIGANLGPLTFADGPNGATSNSTVWGTNTALGVPNINGSNANIMKFVGNTSLFLGEGYYMPTPPPNGGGSLVNDYTIIFDLLYTNAGVFRPLVQMDDGTLDHILAYLAINQTDQIAVTNTLGAALPSSAFGKIVPNTWYRIGIVVNTDAGEIDVYTNGEEAGALEIGTGQVDSPYGLLASSVLPVFSSTTTNAPGYVNSVQVRDAVLNPGEMEALGGPSAAGIPITLPPAHSYIVSRTPDFGDTGIGPEPAVHVVVDQGDATIVQSSFSLSLDGTVVPAIVAAGQPNEFTIDYMVTNILDPLSTHSLSLVYQDSISGVKTNTWQFTIAGYQNLVLPAPIYFENFEELSVINDTSLAPGPVITYQTLQIEPAAPAGVLPAGWAVSNYTAVQDDFYDLTDPLSDYYLNWTTVTTNILATDFTDQSGPYTSPGLGTVNGNGRLMFPPIVLNGALLTNLFEGNLIYCDSDYRQNAGGQVNVLFTGDYDLTGYTNVYVAFHNLYEQNQDNIGSVEYSIDQGVTWLPALYMLDDGSTDGDGSDVVTNTSTGQIDVVATFGTARADQAFNLAYSNFIGAVVSTNLIPFISPRRNDDPVSCKRIEVIRLVSADSQPHVRFRFGQAGTSSWFFGFDDFGLYSINTPVINVQPGSQTVDANTPVTFTVAATGLLPLSYQWKFNGNNIAGATDTSFTLPSAEPADAGIYTVVVTNPDGPTPSAPAQLTINTLPSILTQPTGEIVDLGGTVTFVAQASGGEPLTYLWYANGSLAQSSATPSLTLSGAQPSAAGNYQVVITNNYGVVTSIVALLKVWSGPITDDLVVHLPFDGNFNDTSGRGNNAAYATNGVNANPNPTFVPGKLGQAFEYTTTIDATIQEYATLGYPPDLQFGATNDFSVSFWCNYTNQNDDLPFISNKDWNSSSNPGWGVFTQGGGNYRINVTGPNLGADKFSYTDTPDTLKDGNWHHIVVSFQRAPFGQDAFVYGYLDGALVTKHPMGVVGTIDTFQLPFQNEQNVPDNQSGWAVNIGQDGTGVYYDSGSAFDINAKIDDFGIWRRALTGGEATAIYAAGNVGMDLTQAATANVNISISSGKFQLTWAGNAAVELETTPTLSPATWTAVPGTLGAGAASIPIGPGTAFFRLVKIQ